MHACMIGGRKHSSVARRFCFCVIAIGLQARDRAASASLVPTVGLCSYQPSNMTKATEAAMARANSSVGRVWSANVELNQKKAVVRIRNAAINRVLSPLWAKGPVFVRVIEVSEAQRLKGVTMNPSVTVAFSQSMAKIERMNVNNYKKESLVFADLDEAQLSALGLNWIEGRFWTKEEEEKELLVSSEEDEDDPPELEDEDGADEMEAAVTDSQRIANWAAVVSGNSERAAADAAAEARVAVEAASQLEAAVAAAAIADGDASAAHMARDAAKVEAARAAQIAQETLLAAEAREAAADAAAVAAVEAAVAARIAAEDALVRATPTPARPTTMRITPEMVTPAVTRGGAARSAAREARTTEATREAAAAARAATAAAAAVAVSSGEEEMVRAAKESGCSMTRTGLKKLLAGGYEAEALSALADGGAELYVEVVAEMEGGAAPLNALERASLKKFMVSGAAARAMGGGMMGGRVIDIDEVSSVASSVSGVDEPAPARATPAVAAAAAVAVSGVMTPRVDELVKLLTPAAADPFIAFAVAAVRDAILKRPTRQVEVERPRMTLELWLEKQLNLSVVACKAAAASDADILAMWLMGVLDEKEAGVAKHVSWGSAGGGGGAAGMSAEASLAVIMAAGSAANPSDPTQLAALTEAALDPSVARELEAVKALLIEDKAVEAGAKLSLLTARPCVSAMYYKAGEIKHVQGSAAIAGANTIVVLAGEVRESVEIDVARQIQEMVPPSCDARELARKVVRGKLDEVAFETIFNSKNPVSVMAKALVAERLKGGVDATTESSLLLMRGLALLIVAYARAHPFDVSAASEWARVQSDMARAVQDGLSLEAAVMCILDPIVQELSVRWRDLARRSTAMRPRLVDVVTATKDKRNVHLRQRLELQRGGGGASGGGKEEGKAGKSGEVETPKKVAKQAEEALRVAKAAAAAAKPTAHTPPSPPPKSESAAVKWLEASPDNADKCYYFMKKGSCSRGKTCRFFAGTPGHNSEKSE